MAAVPKTETPTVRPGRPKTIRKSLIRARISKEPMTSTVLEGSIPVPSNDLEVPRKPSMPSGSYRFRELLDQKMGELKKELKKERRIVHSDSTVITIVTHKLRKYDDPKSRIVSEALDLYNSAKKLAALDDARPSEQRDMIFRIEKAMIAVRNLGGIWNVKLPITKVLYGRIRNGDTTTKIESLIELQRISKEHEDLDIRNEAQAIVQQTLVREPGLRIWVI